MKKYTKKHSHWFLSKFPELNVERSTLRKNAIESRTFLVKASILLIDKNILQVPINMLPILSDIDMNPLYTCFRQKCYWFNSIFFSAEICPFNFKINLQEVIEITKPLRKKCYWIKSISFQKHVDYEFIKIYCKTQ